MKPETRTCHGCGQSFLAYPFCTEVLGHEINLTPTYCAGCTDDPDKDPDARKRPENGLEKWRRLCDPFYAEVNAGLLPKAAQKHWKEVVGWHPWSPDTEPPEYQPLEPGLGLIGPSGKGKSMLIHALAKELFLAGHRIHLTYGTELADKLGTPDENRAIKSKCCAVEILLIDDIDKAKWTERVESDIYHIIETRRRHFRPILVTLNAAGGSLEQMLTQNRAEPIVNRLREQCRFIRVDDKT